MSHHSIDSCEGGVGFVSAAARLIAKPTASVGSKRSFFIIILRLGVTALFGECKIAGDCRTIFVERLMPPFASKEFVKTGVNAANGTARSPVSSNTKSAFFDLWLVRVAAGR